MLCIFKRAKKSINFNDALLSLYGRVTQDVLAFDKEHDGYWTNTLRFNCQCSSNVLAVAQIVTLLNSIQVLWFAEETWAWGYWHPQLVA